MNRRTVGDLRVPLSRVAAASGFAVTDQRFYERLNDAVLELMHTGDYPGIVDRYSFRINGGYIVLPGDIERIVAVAINGNPVEMRSPWYEYVAGGPGPQDMNGWTNVVLERGEVATFEQLPAADEPWTILVRGELDERISGVRPVIIIQGYGDDGRWIRSDYNGERIDGVAVAIDGDTNLKQVAAAKTFRSIEAVQKAPTKGYVELWARQGASGPMTMISRYAPRETRPSYRRYFVPSLASSSISRVVARCRARFVPVESERDFLLITNINALKVMIRGLQKRDSDNFDEYAKARLMAVALLNEEAKSYRGNLVQPPISMTAESSMGGGITYLV